jgi:hypothetical protein
VDGSKEEFRNTVERGSASFLSLPGMLLAGSSHSAAAKDEAPYFASLEALDDWFEKGHVKLEDVVTYPYAHRPRPSDRAASSWCDVSVLRALCHLPNCCCILCNKFSFPPRISLMTDAFDTTLTETQPPICMKDAHRDAGTLDRRRA